MPTIAYIRVSSDKQTGTNQHFTIKEYARSHSIRVNRWVEETISSRQDLNKRELWELLTKMKMDSCLIVTEISRLARNLYELATILQYAIKNRIIIISIKENYHFKNDIQSKIMAYTFGLAAEIERDLISTRTKMSLDKLKQQNIRLGRPLRSESEYLRLAENNSSIKILKKRGFSHARISRVLGVRPMTLCRYLRDIKRYREQLNPIMSV